MISMFKNLSLINENRNFYSKIDIIGAGGIGSQTSLALSKIGIKKIRILDFDKVEEDNLANSFIKQDMVGEEKVISLQKTIEIMTREKVGIINKKLTQENIDLLDGDIIISAVDNMETRKILFNYCKNFNKIFIDGRMAALRAEIYFVDTPEKQEKYAKTLVKDEEADEGTCTSKTIIYNTMFIGSIITACVNEYNMGNIPPYKIIYDLKNFEQIKEE